MENSPRSGIFFYFKSVILGYEKSSISPLPSFGGVLRKKMAEMRKAGIHRQQVKATLHFLWEDLIDETFIYWDRLLKVCKIIVLRVEIETIVVLCSYMDATCQP